MWDTISNHISSTTNESFVIRDKQTVGGGSINAAHRVSDGAHSYFVKTNAASRVDMFEAEFDGLNEIGNSATVTVPKPVCFGVSNGSSYIVMEDLSIHGGRGGATDALVQLGIDLANMHRCESGRFGWHRNNTIGSTPQINDPSDDWITFYRDHRLGFQYQLAADHGYGELMPSGQQLMNRLDQFFADYKPRASLLHGDLWSGNYAIDQNGQPVIFDPAVYYGDREADLAMTELFGGFSARFYAAYNDAYPLDAGYKVRKNLYNLYHILNHLNLFGGGYLGQAERMTRQLLSEVR
jgi:fructosamine-3-kinase